MNTLEAINPEMEAEAASAETAFSPEIEAVREKRPEMMRKMLSHGVTKFMFEMTPGVDVITLATEAAYRTTMTGKKLSNEERAYYAAAAVMTGAAWGLYLMGMPKEAAAARLTASAVGAKAFGFDAMRDLLTTAKEGSPKVASLIEKSSDFIKGQEPLMEEMGRNMETYFSENADLLASLY